jgi:hypothetical protein
MRRKCSSFQGDGESGSAGMGTKERYLAARGNGGWYVVLEGHRGATSVHGSAEGAWADARRRARGSGGEALLHDIHGRVRARNTYSIERVSNSK